MGDLSAEPSMEDILSSIKRIIAEEGDDRAPRPRRGPVRSIAAPPAIEDEQEDAAAILELSDPMPLPTPADQAPPAAIVSQQTAQATRGALDSLSRLLVKPEAESDGTLEGLVREMLRPMLREWLDVNLPPLVESMVAREIAKITGAQ